MSTPLVIIMQRLHSDDLCGYLMKGGSSDVYDWLNIPGIVVEDAGSEAWYKEQIEEFGYTNVKPILYNLPVSKGTAALKASSLYFYDSLEEFGRFAYTFITADTASTVASYSDFTVACYWGVTRGNADNRKLVLIDLVVGKWEVPELVVEMRRFWREKNVTNRDRLDLKPKYFYMEDKSSGLFLNQQFLKDKTVRVKPVPRDGTASNAKFDRFLNAIPYFDKGRIILPKHHEHLSHFKLELLGQTSLGPTTNHDDCADNVSDAVVIAFSSGSMSYESWV